MAVLSPYSQSLSLSLSLPIFFSLSVIRGDRAEWRGAQPHVHVNIRTETFEKLFAHRRRCRFAHPAAQELLCKLAGIDFNCIIRKTMWLSEAFDERMWNGRLGSEPGKGRVSDAGCERTTRVFAHGANKIVERYALFAFAADAADVMVGGGRQRATSLTWPARRE